MCVEASEPRFVFADRGLGGSPHSSLQPQKLLFVCRGGTGQLHFVIGEFGVDARAELLQLFAVAGSLQSNLLGDHLAIGVDGEGMGVYFFSDALNVIALIVENGDDLLQRAHNTAFEAMQRPRVPRERTPHDFLHELDEAVDRSGIARIQLPGIAAAFESDLDFSAQLGQFV